MELKKFIKKLEKLSEKHGDNLEVIMADNIPVVNPVFSRDYPKKSIVITDEE